jgi:hypothetical protein
MAHHGNDLENFMNEINKKGIFTDEFKKSVPSEQSERINDLFMTAKADFGATGEFPDGKIVKSDEGEIKIGITNIEDRIIMSFGKPIEWIGFTKKQAKQIAFSLQSRAGFSMWNWMKSWLDAFDNSNGTNYANSIMNWAEQQPTQENAE